MKKAFVYSALLFFGFAFGAGSMVFYSAMWPGGYPGVGDMEVLNFERSPGLVYYFKSDRISLVAHRANNDDPFYLHVVANGKSKHCLGSPDLGGFIEQMSSLKPKKLVEAKDMTTLFPIFLGRIEMLDGTVNISNEPVLFFSSKDGERIAAQYMDVRGEVETSKDLFKALEAGCSKLAMH
ncbi:hypothetical protein ASF11_13785 [Acidovorax sp. Leaf76]|uniref:hypothetical protein n=1 Tax=unclassified Acidovorax TaxID=2684926 RepID=UPI00072BDEA5|nr:MULTISPECIES: hypothetical protein [unclassified Acidovorax]KQO13910.1 hypothetical protein ASF11_13785 [Acidovorax sp. Leaf76]